MEVIDCHTHICFAQNSLKLFAQEHGRDVSFEEFIAVLKNNRISRAFAITEDLQSSTPIDYDNVQNLKSDEVRWIAGINPYKAGKKEIMNTDKALLQKVFVGLKIFLGYYPFFPNDKIYEPFYKLALKHNVPVFFHTGDTFGSNRLLKYAHPLNVDEIAFKFPGLKIVLCHFGNPWCIDAAEVMYKNKNVYADLSGFMVGSFNIRRESNVLFDRIHTALDYCGYDKLLYGSDWPLAGMLDYFRLIKNIIPRSERKNVFAENAKRLFNLQ